MAKSSGPTGNTVALVILGLVGLACLAYAWIGGEDGRLPLSIAGVVCLTLIAVLYRGGDSSEE